MAVPKTNREGYRRDLAILATDHLAGHKVTAFDITDIAVAYGIGWDDVAADWQRVVAEYRRNA